MMKRIYCLALIMSLSVGCSKKGKPCPNDGECGDKLSCEPVTNTCQTVCVKESDCEQSFACDMTKSVCISLVAKVRNDLRSSFAMIPAGSFEMGSEVNEYEKPVHTVKVSSFMMSKTEVTVGQYRTCVKAGVCSEPNIEYGCNWGLSDREDHPINCINRNQARIFAKWIGSDIDLPTEAEWEYAALGGQKFIYAGSNDLDLIAWYENNSNFSTHPVGNKMPNNYGLYDMTGNVSEWALDEWHDNYRGAPITSNQMWGSVSSDVCSDHTKVFSTSRSSFRGGGFGSGVDYVRITGREGVSYCHQANYLGFRLRKSL